MERAETLGQIATAEPALAFRHPRIRAERIGTQRETRSRMPLLDLVPSRVTLDVSGFDLRWLGKTTRVGWAEIESARVDARLRIRTRSGALGVPRNAHGYRQLFEHLVATQRLTLPDRFVWTSTGTTLSLLVCAAIIAGVGLRVSAISEVPFWAGVFLFALAPFAWERYTASEGHLVRVSLFGRREYDVLHGVSWAPATVLGYPWCSVHVRPRLWFHPRGGKPELATRIIDRAPPERPHSASWRASVALTAPAGLRRQHDWLFWGFLTPWFLLASEPATQASVLATCTLLACWLTSGSLITEFRREGVWRLTILGVRFHPSHDFVRVSRQRLVRRDGSSVCLVWEMPVDWILRHWMPNPVAAEHDGYRTSSRGSNGRSVESYAFEL